MKQGEACAMAQPVEAQGYAEVAVVVVVVVVVAVVNELQQSLKHGGLQPQAPVMTKHKAGSAVGRLCRAQPVVCWPPVLVSLLLSPHLCFTSRVSRILS